MPNWKVELIAEAHADFNKLDGSVKKRVLKQFVKLYTASNVIAHNAEKTSYIITFIPGSCANIYDAVYNSRKGFHHD